MMFRHKHKERYVNFHDFFRGFNGWELDNSRWHVIESGCSRTRRAYPPSVPEAATSVQPLQH